MKNIFISAMVLALMGTGCQARQVEHAPSLVAYQPESLTALFTYVDDTDGPVCDMNFSKISEVDLQSDILTTFLNTREIYTEENKADPDTARKWFRRAALRRSLQAANLPRLDDGKDEIAALYAELLPAPLGRSDLETYNTRLAYWDTALTAQRARNDKMSREYSRRYCILSEGRTRDVPKALHWIQQEAEKEAFSLETLEAFFRTESSTSGAFKAKIIENYLAEHPEIPVLNRARLRGRNLYILASDPKTAEAFWQERDLEIDALHNHILTHEYPSLAARLEDMLGPDQSLRKLWSEIQGGETSHFENAEEVKAIKDGIWTRVYKVDAFNTKLFAELMEGREWMRDDQDGAGAARKGWLIVQHADQSPEFQEAMLVKMEVGLNNLGVSKSNFAYLTDRVKIHQTKIMGEDKVLQRYGTQGRCLEGGTWEPMPVEDPENIDEIRAGVGLGTMADYKMMFNCPK